MKISYTACDKCSDPVSEGYLLTSPLRRLHSQGSEEETILEAGEYCTACFVGACMARKLGLEDTQKFGATPPAIPPVREKPLL